jgi:hypothetical protein
MARNSPTQTVEEIGALNWLMIQTPLMKGFREPFSPPWEERLRIAGFGVNALL